MLFISIDDVKTNFSTGFNDWKHSYKLLKQHEQLRITDHSYLHNNKKGLLQVDKFLFTQYEEEVNYWQSVLPRIVSVDRFLSP